MVFMPNDDALEAQCKGIYEAAIAKEGMQLIGWRQVCLRVCVCTVLYCTRHRQACVHIKACCVYKRVAGTS